MRALLFALTFAAGLAPAFGRADDGSVPPPQPSPQSAAVQAPGKATPAAPAPNPPAAVGAPQTVTLRVEQPAAPPPQTVTLRLVADQPQPVQQAALQAVAPATAAMAVHRPGLLSRAVGAVGDRVGLIGRDRIYLPSAAAPAAAVVQLQQPAAVQQVQYVAPAAPVVQLQPAPMASPQASLQPVYVAPARTGGLKNWLHPNR